jgi:hypothetical protein
MKAWTKHRSGTLPRWTARLCAAGLALATGPGCERRPAEPAPEPPPETRRETFARGPVRVTVSARPARVDLHRDMVLAVEIAAPPHVEVRLPSTLDDRFQGFTVRGMIQRETAPRDGRAVSAYEWLLTPQVADEYRLAPFPVHYTDATLEPPVTEWFATRPVVFSFRAPTGTTDDISAPFEPLFVWPGPRTWLLYGGLLLAGAVVLRLLYRLTRRARAAVRRWRLSPRERALQELTELLAGDLIARERVKEFYMALTLIVRRYIERAHKVRAPERTTEEFLAEASRSPRFTRPALATLQRFLEAADLVKFAAYRPAAGDVEDAVRTARAYIETDAADTDAEPKRNETDCM